MAPAAASTQLCGGHRDDIKKGGAKAREVAEKFRDRMELFDSLLHDPERAEFVLVSIATALSAAESARLAAKLLDADVALRHVVVNQAAPATRDPRVTLSS